MDTVDPLGELAAVARRLAEAERSVREIRLDRDQGIKECREAGHTIREIAEAAGVSGTTVKSVLR